MFKRILVPTDGSVLSDAAIVEAAKLAKELGSTLVLFYSPLMQGLSPPIRPSENHSVRKLWESQAEAILATAAGSIGLAGVPVEQQYLASNSPNEAIIEAANEFDCDLIVMASHARTGLSKVVHGSETESVLAKAKVPVIVVR
jgi:nucleotide-binding universal stress UspA family protein